MNAIATPIDDAGPRDLLERGLRLWKRIAEATELRLDLLAEYRSIERKLLRIAPLDALLWDGWTPYVASITWAGVSFDRLVHAAGLAAWPGLAATTADRPLAPGDCSARLSHERPIRSKPLPPPAPAAWPGVTS